MKVYFILLLSIILVSTIPLSFAPSHPIGGQQQIEDMESTSASTFTCDRDSEGNLISSLSPRSFCDFQDGLIDCNNPFDHFHNPSVCDALDPDNTGFMNLMILIFVIIGILIVVLVLVRRRK